MLHLCPYSTDAQNVFRLQPGSQFYVTVVNDNEAMVPAIAQERPW